MTRRRVAVVDHGMGNLPSVAKALEAAGAAVDVTTDPAAMSRSDALCVPGQGIFGRCVAALQVSGIDDLIRDWIAAERPYLGICLGMQVLFESSDEHGPTRGLSILEGTVARLSDRVVVPHIGWNLVADDYFYFDHSYAAHPVDHRIVTGWCEHGERFAASIQRGSITGVQFHPEKSSAAGIALLGSWVNG